jgi:hypothetical protein
MKGARETWFLIASYTAPEQVTGQEVTTATGVYQLSVLA